MMGNTHRLFGAVCGAAYGHAIGADMATIIMTASMASVFSHGATSPDMDQKKPWVRFNRWTPAIFDPLLAHRRLSHWWGLPVLAWFGIHAMPEHLQVPFIAALVGWVSHIVGDAIFGKIPVSPWGGWYVGVGLETGGFIESGRLRILGRERTVLPFGPVKLAMLVGIGWLLFAPFWTQVATQARDLAGR